mmetsp:Transcript_9029/g.15507  ORF Transcript_9029/g.15507 Transcript_9029/m.15507 type:complete len:648 (-) Transcript_9029:247-2190(-)
MAAEGGEPVLEDVSPADDFDVGENTSDEEDANPASVHQVTVYETSSMTSDVSYLEEARRLSKLRENNVLDLAKRIEDGTLLTIGEAAEARAKTYQEGRQLLQTLFEKSQDLRGRCVGRNYDDAHEIYEGLESMLETWEEREEDLEGLKVDAMRAALEYKQASSMIADKISEVKNDATKKLFAAKREVALAHGSAEREVATAKQEAEVVTKEKEEWANAMVEEAHEKVATSQLDLERMRQSFTAQFEEENKRAQAEISSTTAQFNEATLKRESELRHTKAHLEAELAKAYESVASEVEKLKHDASNTSSTAAIEIQDMQDQMQQLDGELQDSLKASESMLEKLTEAHELLAKERATSSKALARVEALEVQMQTLAQTQNRRDSDDSDLGQAQRQIEELTSTVEFYKHEARIMRERVDSIEATEQSALQMALPAKPPKQHQEGLMVTGVAALGSTLRVAGPAALLPQAKAQWHRVQDGVLHVIAGATRVQYAPEPNDVGYIIACAVTPQHGEKSQLALTESAISVSSSLVEHVSMLMAAGAGVFDVIIVQLNGAIQGRRTPYQLEVTKEKIKIKLNGSTKFKEKYSTKMQVCGARGAGDAASQGLFLALSPQLVFMLACESSRERNAAIMLMRKFAGVKNIALGGPEAD